MAEVEFIGLEGIQAKLKGLQTSRDIGKDLNRIIKDAIGKARTAISKEARTTVGTGYKYSAGDPRAAYKAVRHSAYKRIFGGQVNILASKKASSIRGVMGNLGARGLSTRSLKLATYYGKDRGFILRFLNAGTDGRAVENLNNHPLHRTLADRTPKGAWKNHQYKTRKYEGSRLGNRGKLAAKNWFPGASQKEMEKAAALIAENIDKAIQELWNS